MPSTINTVRRSRALGWNCAITTVAAAASSTSISLAWRSLAPVTSSSGPASRETSASVLASIMPSTSRA